MTINHGVTNKSPYLRTSREFPNKIEDLSEILNKTYLETASAVNSRTIGIYPTNKPAIIGDVWFISGSRFQALRQVYLIPSGGGPIPHGIDLKTIKGFTDIYGTFTDGSTWYPLPFVSVVAANNQVNIFVNSTNIQVTGGGGAGQPVISSGFVVLEWISLV